VSTTLNENSESRRIILLRLHEGEIPEVLLGFAGTQWTLPEVVIPSWQRVAENLTAALKDTCGIDAISLASLDASPADSHSAQVRYEIMEPCRPREKTPQEKRWEAIDSLVSSAFRDPRDFEALRQAIAQSTARADGTSIGPFGTLGWFSNLEQWVEEQIAAHGFHLSGGFRQLNACPTFSLIRFETDGPAVWFKAAGVPNQREYPITLALARSFSRFVPQIIATRPESNGWLAREAEGPLLLECSTLESWETAARDLAELQIHSLGRSLHLLDSGARDLRAGALAALVEPFFSAMRQLMELQTKTPPAALSREELRCLAARVRDALTVLDETGVPTTLGHLDLNPGNIVCSPTGCVFLDWAEAFVGHPYLTFEYLREYFRQNFGPDNSQETQLVGSYTSPWHAFVSERDIRSVLEVTPLVAVFACAAGYDVWTAPRKLDDPRSAGYLRSLTRRMHREARALVERSVSCPS
jgi:hypothetical protein